MGTKIYSLSKNVAEYLPLDLQVGLDMEINNIIKQVKKATQKELLEEMREHHLKALNKTENEKAMLCHTFFIKYVDNKLSKK